MGWYYDSFPPYVSVEDRKKKAANELKKLQKKGKNCEPVVVNGQKIVNTFWGKAWCDNLNVYKDHHLDERLSRGRSCVRHGAILDLKINAGEVNALVSGSSVYKVKIKISKIVFKQWDNIIKECSGKIDSLIELLQGKFSQGVMHIITDPKKGLFPSRKEIKFNCSCPDYADMCKHVAAVLYGIGVRFEESPEKLFELRQVDHLELMSKMQVSTLVNAAPDQDESQQVLADSDLSSLFGIDMDNTVSRETVSAEKLKINNKSRIKQMKKPAMNKNKIKKKASVKKIVEKKLKNKVVKNKVVKNKKTIDKDKIKAKIKAKVKAKRAAIKKAASIKTALKKAAVDKAKVKAQIKAKRPDIKKTTAKKTAVNKAKIKNKKSASIKTRAKHLKSNSHRK